jgi:hypothetical protein
MLLLAWRFWSVAAGALLGVTLAVHSVEWRELRALVRRER